MASHPDSYWCERRGKDMHREGDIRSPYERDYARVVHASAFRRLQAKTQILNIGDSDFHRTRLTHSMEASQIGEGIARKLCRDHEEDEEVRSVLPCPVLIRTLCLAHDFGHPPFGHGGEMALNRCMLPYGGFEGNGQTLRIITRLESYHEHYGMDLTRRTVLGLIKYPARYSEVVNWCSYPGGADAYENARQQGCTDEDAMAQAQAASRADLTSPLFVADEYKPPKCYLDTEQDLVIHWAARDISEWASIAVVEKNEEEHGQTRYQSLDASIMDMADDIAYGIHDLEDAVNLSFVDKQLFEAEVGQLLLEPLLFERFRTLDNDAHDRWLDLLFSSETCERKQIIGQLVNYCLQNVYLDRVHEHGSSCPVFRFQARMKRPARDLLERLKDFVEAHVIRRTPVQQLEFKHQKIVTELFHAFVTDPKRLLARRQYEKIDQAGGAAQQAERVICDYIAGMTDESATRRYQQLFEARTGSVFDRL